MTALGEVMPEFVLRDTQGKEVAAPGVGPAVVFFTSNICPFALAWHDRIIDVARDYVQRGVSFFAISSNDAELSPADSPRRMRERYQREDWGPVPYLRDEDQAVALAYAAETTPDVFVLDDERRLRYRGAPDEDCEEPELRARLLRAALDGVLTGSAPPAVASFSVGCPIKWHGRPAHPPGMGPPTTPGTGR